MALLALVSVLCTLCLVLLRAEPDVERTTDGHNVDTAYVDAPTIKGIDPGMRFKTTAFVAARSFSHRQQLQAPDVAQLLESFTVLLRR